MVANDGLFACVAYLVKLLPQGHFALRFRFRWSAGIKGFPWLFGTFCCEVISDPATRKQRAVSNKSAIRRRSESCFVKVVLQVAAVLIQSMAVVRK